MDKIHEPGIYDGIDMDFYHGDPCVGPSISGSGLTLIERRCAAVFWAQSPLNPNRFKAEETTGLSVGKAAHAIILEGEAAFRQTVAVKPEDFNGRTKAGKAWVAEREEIGLTIINFDQWRMIQAMVEAVRRHPEASKAFSDGVPERSMFWTDEPTGIWLRSRPDWWPNNSRFYPNYKTTISAKRSDFERQAHAFGYHQSAALLVDGVKTLTGESGALPYLVVQEKAPPFLVLIATFSDEALDWGRILNRRAIDTFARGIETGIWESYADGVVQIDMPVWMERGLQKRHEAGDFIETHTEQPETETAGA